MPSPYVYEDILQATIVIELKINQEKFQDKKDEDHNKQS